MTSLLNFPGFTEFVQDSTEPNKVVDADQQPIKRYLRVKRGPKQRGAKKLIDSIRVEINGDHEVVADKLIARIGDKHTKDTLWVELMPRGGTGNDVEDFLEIPKQVAGSTENPLSNMLTPMRGADGTTFMAVTLDPMAQMAFAMSRGFEKTIDTQADSLRRAEATNARQGREITRITSEVTAMRVMFHMMEDEAGPDRTPMMDGFKLLLDKFEGPIAEISLGASLIAQTLAGVSTPQAAQKPAPAPAPAPQAQPQAPADDDDVIDITGTPTEPTEEEIEGLVERLQVELTELLLARPKLITMARAQRLLPILNAGNIPIGVLCLAGGHCANLPKKPVAT